MAQTSHSPEEVARLGEAIYAERIKPQIEAGHIGEFVVLDVESGDFEVDPEEVAAAKRIIARRPNGVLYWLRVGSRSAYRLGVRFTVQPS